MGQESGQLSDRGREILDLIARGHKHTDIAQMLYLSPKTIRNHASNILYKLRFCARLGGGERVVEVALI